MIEQASIPTTGNMTSKPALGDDMLNGAEAIAAFMGLSPRQVYHQAKRLPVFYIGAMLCARRSTLLGWVQSQEAAAPETVSRRKPSGGRPGRKGAMRDAS